ncbi:MAG: TonB-dependent receptor [Sphingomonadales bacterium]|nr:TonB-dependent receptor [Sphingomonadales bacterium]
MLALTLSAGLAPVARAQDHDDDDEGEARPSGAPAEIVVAAHRLDAARAGVEPDLGASTFTLSNDALELRPGGETTTIADVLLQTPGVAQAGKGQFSLRGSPQGIQYRINNVILPDGITDLGEQLSPRLADKIELITGALPAQYGLETGGVVNITTKNGLYGQQGEVELYGGGEGQIEPAFEFSGASGRTSYFVTGSYVHDAVGLASPDGRAHPAHDGTDQFEGLTFLDHVIDAHSRISLVAGLSDEHFQIPENAALNLTAPGLVDPANPVDGGGLHQANQYGALSYLASGAAGTLQLSVFARHAQSGLRAGASAGLPLTGLGGTASSTSEAAGLQAEGALEVGARHTLRAGGLATFERLRSGLDALAFALGAPAQAPLAITNVDRLHRREGSLFIEDEWKPFDGLTVNIGGRFDTISDLAQGSAFGPRASLVWAAPSGTTLHAAYARYLVAPPLQPQGAIAALAGTSALQPGATATPLRRELDDYYDAGVQQKLGELTFGLDGFWREARDLLAEMQDGSPLITQPYNYGQGRLRGLVASASYDEGPFAGWANFTWLDAAARGIVSGGATIPASVIDYAATHWVLPEGTQRWSGSAGATYKIGRLGLGAEMLYASGLPRTPLAGNPAPGSLSGYVQIDLSLTTHLDGLRGRPLDLRCDVINLLDRRYMISDEGPDGLAQWGPRRGVFIGFEQAF